MFRGGMREMRRIRTERRGKTAANSGRQDGSRAEEVGGSRLPAGREPRLKRVRVGARGWKLCVLRGAVSFKRPSCGEERFL